MHETTRVLLRRGELWGSGPIGDLHAAVRDGGARLPPGLQRRWGRRLGADLSSIRVHVDSPASRATARGGARAMAFGSDLFFAPGAYDPTSQSGLRLLGHEVAHAVQAPAPRRGSARMGVSPGEPGLEAEADRVGSALAAVGSRPVRLRPRSARPALRGDKRITFSGTDLTVTDTYAIYGPGASAAFLATFQSALSQYYTTPTFTHRTYNVRFNLSVRQVAPNATGTTDTRFDSSISLFYVETGSGGAGGIGIITLYDTDPAAVIAHEVGHALSDKIGYFSEHYSESLRSRFERVTGMGPGTGTVPEPSCAGDIMADLSGTVTACSLADFLDFAITRHEAASSGPTVLIGPRR